MTDLYLTDRNIDEIMSAPTFREGALVLDPGPQSFFSSIFNNVTYDYNSINKIADNVSYNDALRRSVDAVVELGGDDPYNVVIDGIPSLEGNTRSGKQNYLTRNRELILRLKKENPNLVDLRTLEDIDRETAVERRRAEESLRIKNLRNTTLGKAGAYTSHFVAGAAGYVTSPPAIATLLLFYFTPGVQVALRAARGLGLIGTAATGAAFDTITEALGFTRELEYRRQFIDPETPASDVLADSARNIVYGAGIGVGIHGLIRLGREIRRKVSSRFRNQTDLQDFVEATEDIESLMRDAPTAANTNTENFDRVFGTRPGTFAEDAHIEAYQTALNQFLSGEDVNVSSVFPTAADPPANARNPSKLAEILEMTAEQKRTALEDRIRSTVDETPNLDEFRRRNPNVEGILTREDQVRERVEIGELDELIACLAALPSQ